MTSKTEDEILNAFKAIHALGVVHGDVRAENILITKDRNAVWIIDFEFAEIMERASEAESMIYQETEAVKQLLNEFKERGNQVQNGSTFVTSQNKGRLDKIVKELEDG